MPSALFSDSFVDRITAVKIPTHVLVGSQDTLTPVGDAQEICMHIKGAELSIVYGTAHGMIVESPIHAGRLILDGIDRADSLALSRPQSKKSSAAKKQ